MDFMLSCSNCTKDLDLDEAPDTGLCPVCNGELVEYGEKAETLRQGFNQAVEEAIGSGLSRIAHVTNRKAGNN